MLKQLDMFQSDTSQSVIHGDCLDIMKSMSDNSIDFIVTDPPYSLSFMGKKWDDSLPSIEIWKEALRICKPGAWLASFGGTRTYHRLTCNIEDSGWGIRDCIMWLYGSGFPKGKGCLKPAYEPIILAMKPLDGTFAQNAKKWGVAGINIDDCRILNSTGQRLLDKISENEVLWEQEKHLCNSCVKHVENKTKQEILEIVESFAIKNVDRILIENVKQFLIDLNILDIGCLDIHCQEEQKKRAYENLFSNMSKSGKNIMGLNQKDMLSIILTMIPMTTELKICNLCKEAIMEDITEKNIIVLKKETLNMLKEHVKKENGSRWPSNLILDEESAEMLDQKSGFNKSKKISNYEKSQSGEIFKITNKYKRGSFHEDSGGASRFFYCAKASSSERNRGLEGMPLKEKKTMSDFPNNKEFDPSKTQNKSGSPSPNFHPTVKPISLMKYILKLLAPPGNPTCLDPFCGSGSTLLAAKELGINCIGIEKEAEYVEIAKARIKC